MNRFIFGTAVLASGLLFCCPKVEAAPNRCMDVYYISAEEATELKQVAVLEAGETDVDGIAHVMQVVLNRKYSEDFPDTIEGCILEKGQFTTVKKLQAATVTEAADEALQAVIAGQYQDNQALYFESLPGKVWNSVHDFQFSYGGHDFYK